jgi:hypothetical protein
MNNVKELADNLIHRAKNLQEFTVFRNFDDIVFNGVMPYTISHTVGYPVEITVPAISQDEAEQRVDEWLHPEDF